MYISTTKAAKLLGISRVHVFRLIKAGKIKAVKAGRNYIIDERDLPEILGKVLAKTEREEINQAVRKTVKEYGETLKLLGKE